MRKKKEIVLILVIILLTAFSCRQQAINREAQIEDLLANKQDATILVTDSGLGGLSVAAELEARLSKTGIFRQARIVFYNALFDKIGYNGLDSEPEKIRIFNKVLKAMDKKYKPDLLLIACNTLSVLYDRTPFSKRAQFPVVGIVETGVDLMLKQFELTPEATVIIFGTKTTIESEAYKKALMARGIPANRIVGQACHKLAGAIERGVESDETIGYIRQFVQEALTKVEDKSRLIFGSFNCTHYGYARKQFEKAFALNGYPDITIIDPNQRMIDFLFEPQYLNRYPKTKVSLEAVSKLEITDQVKASLSPLLATVSPATAEALQNYAFDPELFKVSFKKPKKE
jgi:glutamate racemase